MGARRHLTTREFYADLADSTGSSHRDGIRFPRRRRGEKRGERGFLSLPRLWSLLASGVGIGVGGGLQCTAKCLAGHRLFLQPQAKQLVDEGFRQKPPEDSIGKIGASDRC